MTEPIETSTRPDGHRSGNIQPENSCRNETPLESGNREVEETNLMGWITKAIITATTQIWEGICIRKKPPKEQEKGEPAVASPTVESTEHHSTTQGSHPGQKTPALKQQTYVES